MAEKNGAPVSNASMPLFLEDIYDALRAIVAALGGPKVVACKLWPMTPPEQARRQLLDALNRDNPRKLDPEEVMALLRMGRDAGFHEAKHWIDGTLGYERAAPVDPEDELAGLLREYVDHAQRLASLAPRIEEMRLKV